MEKFESLRTGRRQRFMMSVSQTAADKSLVQEFYDQVFTRGDTSDLDRFMRDD